MEERQEGEECLGAKWPNARALLTRSACHNSGIALSFTGRCGLLRHTIPFRTQSKFYRGAAFWRVPRRRKLLRNYWEQKTDKLKTHKHFSDGPCGTIVPGTNPHPSQGQTGQNSDFIVELNRERPVCPRTGPILSRGGVPFVPGTVPVCSGDRPAENVYVYWFFFLPD